MVVSKLLTILFTSFLLLNSVFAQKIVLESKVRDSNTHRPISAVNIYVKDLNIGTVSNTAGRFEIEIVRPEPQMIVVFQHIAYDTLELTVEEVLSSDAIDMQERVVLAPVVEVEALENQLEFEKDLPQTVSVIDDRVFDLRGYIDAGDLLRTDHSIQVDEELSGKKTISIRGGNPEEVIVLYNGIKMNSALDNIYDISLIDLSDVDRFEVIKGSNTTLYGPEASSGVVNVVPRSQHNYNIRFQQQFGTYNSGNWGLHTYKKLGHFHGSYSLKRGKSQREFVNEPPGQRLLENSSDHHTASLAYNFSETATGLPESSFGILYNRTETDFENERDSETLSNLNQMISGRFNGNLAGIKHLTVSGGYQWLDESQFLQYHNIPTDFGFLDRNFDSRSIHLNADKSIYLKRFELLLGYQYENTKLNFHDKRISFNENFPGSESATIHRKSHGFISIAKIKPPSASDFLRGIDFDLSFRYDMVEDEEINPKSQNGSNYIIRDAEDSHLSNQWEEATVKFSTHLSGNNGVFSFNSFLNIGTNVKFPTLQQQISKQEVLSTELPKPNLRPEKNRSLEIGFNLTQELDQKLGIYGWQISGNFFRNSYENKVRSFFLPGTPIAVYDNVKEADISGFETKESLFLFRKKITAEFGASHYYFSDQATFPFKHNRKYTFNLLMDHAGYALQFYAFKEGEQIAQIRNIDGGYSEQRIPEFSNIDLHFSKSFDLSRLKLILNFSARNILDDDYELEGFTLRDRRYYLTLGIQY